MTEQAATSTGKTPYEPHFTVAAEGDLELDDHEAIAATLAKAFPDYLHWYQGARSWAGMQPEKRVVARSGDVVVAHAGIRRMFVTVGETDLLIAAVGMVAVSPILQGTGLGGQLLRLVDAVLDGMAVPFGLLESGEHTQPFYRKHGWELLSDVSGHYNEFTAEGAATRVTSDTGWLVRPCHSEMLLWPAGDVHWNGQMV